MNIDDLQYIFKDQLTTTEEKLFYILTDNDTSTICRTSRRELESLLLTLDCFVYNGDESRIPHFTKNPVVTPQPTEKD